MNEYHEYKVVSMRYSSDAGETAINQYAHEGWKLHSVVSGCAIMWREAPVPLEKDDQ